MSLATMSLTIIVPRNKFYNRLKQKKYDNSNKRFALFTLSSNTKLPFATSVSLEIVLYLFLRKFLQVY